MTHDGLIEATKQALANTTNFDGDRLASHFSDSELRDMARAAIRVIAPAVLEEAAKVVLDDGNYRKNNRGDAYIELLAMKIGYEQ